MQLERIHVSEVMHRGVLSCKADASGWAVARIMAAHRVHSVVVRRRGEAFGVVTDADLAAVVGADGLDTALAADLARPAPLLRPSDSLAFALTRMHDLDSTHAVVIGRTRLLGVVSVLDIVESLLRAHDRAGVAPVHG